MVPESTPREVLYIEPGLLDIETTTDKNRIMMGERLKKKENQLLNEITSLRKTWERVNTQPGKASIRRLRPPSKKQQKAAGAGKTNPK